MLKKSKKVRPIAFVLPQFHPIPENDKWWGKGFTEWTNVTKAKPLFKGHYQPHLPTDLGFYDLRLPEAREAQANIAKEHGIYGFCYYHYWFNGKRLLNQPLDGMLESGKPDMPFMFCWANENWTRRWDGLDKEVLIEQNYSFKDDAEHMRWLCENVFSDSRYIKINNRPVFILYRPDLFPDIKKTVHIWREIVKNEFDFNDLYLCYTESFDLKIDPSRINFNTAIEFSPHQILEKRITRSKRDKFLENFSFKKKLNISFRDFKAGVEASKKRKTPSYKLFRCVTPAWDNTARRKNGGAVSLGSSPELYQEWLETLIEKFKPYSKEENFIFINAMNEWAEGNHLEPCIKYGRGYLEATRKALENNNG